MLNSVVKIFNLKSSSRGQSIIEFGFILPLLLLLVFGITELGRMLMQANMLTQACREGARAAAVGEPADSVVAWTTNILSTAGVNNNVDVTLSGPDGNNMMQVEATCDFDVIPNNLLGFGTSLKLRGVSSMRLEQ